MVLSCEANGCNEVAVARYFWPGRDPLRACSKHLAQAHGVAEAMGMHLASERLPGNAEVRSLVDDLTKRSVDEGSLLALGWQAFRLTVIPLEAGDAQVEDMRFAFYAGAQHLFRSMMSYLDEGRDPTEDDVRRMQNLDEELRAWEASARQRVGL